MKINIKLTNESIELTNVRNMFIHNEIKRVDPYIHIIFENKSQDRIIDLKDIKEIYISEV